MLGLRDYIWENTRFTVRSSAKHLTMFGLFGVALVKRCAEKKRYQARSRRDRSQMFNLLFERDSYPSR